MPQQQQHLANTIEPTALEISSQSAGAHSYTNISVDLIIIEAGLRLKVLPLRDAIIKGRQLRISKSERRVRQSALLKLCGAGPVRIVDIGLFADAVARFPDIAEQLSRIMRPGRSKTPSEDKDMAWRTG